MGDHDCPEGEHYDAEKGECVAMEKSDFITKSEFESSISALRDEVLGAIKGLNKADEDEDEEEEEEEMEKGEAKEVARLEAKLDKFLEGERKESPIATLEKKIEEVLELRKAEGADAPGSGDGGEAKPEAIMLMKSRWDNPEKHEYEFWRI